MTKKEIAVDFDGVIHQYSKGWHDGSIYDAPMAGVKEALIELGKKYKIVVFSRRAVHQGRKVIKDWLDINQIPYDRITKIKPKARWYIDDRAVHFTTWPETLKEIEKLDKKYISKNS